MKTILILCIALALLSCESKQQSPQGLNWHGSMQGLAASLTNILPEIASQNTYKTPMAQRQLNKAINDLRDYSESLTNLSMNVPSGDPSIRYVALDFKNTVQRIQKNKDAIDKKQLRDLTKYCIACHTRTRSGSSYFSSVEPSSLEKMRDIDKANYYAATRQFEKALVHYETALQDKTWAKQNPKSWNESVLKLLTITVRVHNNPNLTLEIISSLFDGNAYPKKLNKAARVWQSDAKRWDSLTNEKAELESIVSLIKKSVQREKKLRHSGLILNLRALAILNTYLKNGDMKSKSEQAVLYYTGLVTKSLGELDFAGFPNSYFKACIDVDPKTKISRKCKAQLKKS